MNGCSEADEYVSSRIWNEKNLVRKVRSSSEMTIKKKKYYSTQHLKFYWQI